MQKTTYGLIGKPLNHSFSQQFFTDYFKELQIDETNQYLNFELDGAGDFPDLLERYPDLRGINVTTPYKTDIIPHLTRLDETARKVGAVNCIRVEEDGSTTGFNTDYLGFQEDLANKLHEQRWTEHAFQVDSTPASVTENLGKVNALVLGSGGASAAVVHALESLGMEPLIVSRTGGQDRLTYETLLPEYFLSYHLVVNTTTLGMYPDVDSFPDIPYQALGPAHFCYDLIYNPAETLFLRKSREQGAGTANGLGMLHAQAHAGWRIWNTWPDEYKS